MSTPSSLRIITKTMPKMTPLVMLLSRLPSVWARWTRRVVPGSSNENASPSETPPTEILLIRWGRMPSSALRTNLSIARCTNQRTTIARMTRTRIVSGLPTSQSATSSQRSSAVTSGCMRTSIQARGLTAASTGAPALDHPTGATTRGPARWFVGPCGVQARPSLRSRRSTWRCHACPRPTNGRNH